MYGKRIQRLLAVFFSAALVLSACTPVRETAKESSDALTWGTWGNYEEHKEFLDLLNETCPDIELEFVSYTGGNKTGYSWAQMRADDIPDIFITSQILDEELAKERLADLSGYPFINSFSTSILDQVSIDGGIYLLPTSYAMYGIFYNKTLMEEYGWSVPKDLEELEALCGEIREAGLIPGVISTQLTGGPFSTMFNLAKTDWLTTPDGVQWEQDFLAGNATASGRWEDTMDLAERYMDMGMFYADPEDRNSPTLILDYLGQRKAVFCTAVQTVNISEFPDTKDQIGIMPFISEDGSKNIYMYSPTYYFGISKRLTDPGNEKKLEDAVRLLSLLYSPEGQAVFVDEATPCLMSTLNNADVQEDSMIYDAGQALQDGRAFPMTYAGWEQVLSDMGQVYKEWFRGEGGMDKDQCIARMDELMQDALDHSDQLYFCECTEDFTLEETGELVGKVLGSAVGADAALIPLGGYQEGGIELRAGITGKLYKGKINMDVASTICPWYDGEYALMTMTGAQAKELAKAGLCVEGGQEPYPYLLVTKGGAELEDDAVCQVAFLAQGYTEEMAETFSAQVCTGSLREFLRAWLEEKKTVSPDSNPWE